MRSGRRLFQFADDKSPSIPDFVGEVAVCFHFLQTEIGIVAGGGADQQREAQRIGAHFIHDDQRIDHVALGLAHFLAVFVADQAVQIDGMEGDLTGKFQPVHDHARHPEEEDVVTGLQH